MVISPICIVEATSFMTSIGLGWIDHCCRMSHTTEVSHHHAETMIQRYRNAHAGTRLDSGRFSHEEGIVDQIVMRKGGAFRQSRGAARELDIDGIVDLNRRRYRVEPLATDLFASLQYPVKREAAIVFARD